MWNYAQAIGRLFPELERDTRERVDLGIALRPTGEIGNRGECADAAASFADGQCGTILRIYREHQMSPDSSFLTRTWPKVRTAVEFLVSSRDGADEDGIFRGSQWNTLDTQWFGEIPWISGLYVACLRAASAMATEVGDTASATRYAAIADRGAAYISSNLWSEQYGYYIHKTDPAHPSMNTNRGCFIDQLYGQTYASQLGLPRVFPADKARTALAGVFRNNFQPDPASYRPPGIKLGRVYTTSGEAGTIMATWPNGGSTESGGLRYFNEVWTGQEYQFAAHLFAEGMAAEGLAVTRAIYDRYAGQKRNPYNEIEASDHYTRAMMGFGTYLAACGYEYHGPAGHLGFAPRIGPDDFRCAFTAASGWGLYRQTRSPGRLDGAVEVRHGTVRLVTLSFETQVAGHGRDRSAGRLDAACHSRCQRQPRRRDAGLARRRRHRRDPGGRTQLGGSAARRSQFSTPAMCAVIQARAASPSPASSASTIAARSASVRSTAPAWVTPRQTRARWVAPETPSSSEQTTALPVASAIPRWKRRSLATSSSTSAAGVSAADNARRPASCSGVIRFAASAATPGSSRRRTSKNCRIESSRCRSTMKLSASSRCAESRLVT